MIGASQTKDFLMSQLMWGGRVSNHHSTHTGVENQSVTGIRCDGPNQESSFQTATVMAQATMAHEVVPSLGVIAGGPWGLQDSYGCSEDKHESAIECSLCTALYTQNLLEDLKDNELIRNGLYEISLEKIDLSAVVREAIEDFEPMVKDRQLRFDGDPAFILGDRERIQRLLFHLLLNASKYSDPACEIKVDVWRRGTHVCLFVQDQGRTLLSAELEQMFLPPTLMDSNKNVLAANKLSLTSVKRIVNSHGGTISVQRAARQGSVFHVSFRSHQ